MPDINTSQEVSTNGVGHGFGTAPVFLATVSTILGAILFLRLGYAVAHVGLAGALLIIFIGHLVTIPTALAIAEIATNRRVEGGGAYFIISRSFGTTIGGSIGVSLYFSQALSIAFYMIAFAEAFHPLGPYYEQITGYVFDPRIVSVPSTIAIAVLVVTRGASIGMKALWVVVGTLAVSLVLFFVGARLPGSQETGLFETIPDGDPFILVFAIIFPAFTGMLAGVGLSGDLANPRTSIPYGILTATGAGLVIYLAAAVKLAASASPADLAADQLIMSRIAVWGPIIPIGLACATLSSAIGSILVAPRTLQALAGDGIVPNEKVNRILAEGVGKVNEPRAASIVTSLIAIVTVAMGNIDFVARIISMFFMVTYGALCAISFLEHFAARPSYRPSFRSKWYLSLLGAIVCLLLMFQMDPFYAILAILIMIVIYRGIRGGRVDDLAAIFKGVMTQTTRYFQVRLQKERMRVIGDEWRPSIIMVNGQSFSRSAPFQFLAWLCHRYGFGTYLHYIQGRLDDETFRQSRFVLKRLIGQTEARRSSVYVDTIVSPSLQTALAQSLQVPGVSGMENNTALFEFSAHDPPEAAAEVAGGCFLAGAARMNALVLRHGDHFFGARSRVHIWLTWHDYKNASLMILLAYILLGHDDWDDAEIKIFAAFPYEEVAEQRARLNEMMVSGRLPISEKNLRIIPTDDQVDFHTLVERRSSTSDLVILGFTEERLQEKGPELFMRHPSLRDVLFVSAHERILIE